VRLGEERFLVHREQHLLLDVAGDAHGEDATVFDTRLLRIDALEPGPGEVPACHAEHEPAFVLCRAGKRQRDAPDVRLGRQLYITTRRR
jgi:hypothetical protein